MISVIVFMVCKCYQPSEGPGLMTLGTLRSNDATATRMSLKKVYLRSFSLYRDYSYPITLSSRGTLLKLNFKGPYPSSEREIKFRRCLFTSCIKHEIRHFHVVVVQKRERSVMHEQSYCFAYKTYCFFDVLVTVCVVGS